MCYPARWNRFLVRQAFKSALAGRVSPTLCIFGWVSSTRPSATRRRLSASNWPLARASLCYVRRTNLTRKMPNDFPEIARLRDGDLVGGWCPKRMYVLPGKPWGYEGSGAPAGRLQGMPQSEGPRRSSQFRNFLVRRDLDRNPRLAAAKRDRNLEKRGTRSKPDVVPAPLSPRIWCQPEPGAGWTHNLHTVCPLRNHTAANVVVREDARVVCGVCDPSGGRLRIKARHCAVPTGVFDEPSASRSQTGVEGPHRRSGDSTHSAEQVVEAGYQLDAGTSARRGLAATDNHNNNHHDHHDDASSTGISCAGKAAPRPCRRT